MTDSGLVRQARLRSRMMSRGPTKIEQVRKFISRDLPWLWAIRSAWPYTQIDSAPRLAIDRASRRTSRFDSDFWFNRLYNPPYSNEEVWLYVRDETTTRVVRLAPPSTSDSGQDGRLAQLIIQEISEDAFTTHQTVVLYVVCIVKIPGGLEDIHVLRQPKGENGLNSLIWECRQRNHNIHLEGYRDVNPFLPV